MMISLFILQASGPGGLIGAMWPLLLMFVVIFFFFIRPQAKKQKEQTKFLDTLDKGEEVVTASGFIGRINKIEGPIVTLAIAEKTFVREIREIYENKSDKFCVFSVFRRQFFNRKALVVRHSN